MSGAYAVGDAKVLARVPARRVQGELGLLNAPSGCSCCGLPFAAFLCSSESTDVVVPFADIVAGRGGLQAGAGRVTAGGWCARCNWGARHVEVVEVVLCVDLVVWRSCGPYADVDPVGHFVLFGHPVMAELSRGFAIFSMGVGGSAAAVGVDYIAWHCRECSSMCALQVVPGALGVVHAVMVCRGLLYLRALEAACLLGHGLQHAGRVAEGVVQG